MSLANTTAVVARDPDARDWGPAESVPVRSYFVFRLGASLYALPGELVGQVAAPVVPVRVPGAPAHVLGVVQLHERIVAVVDAHAVLGTTRLAETDGAQSRLILFEILRAPFAAIVDAALGVRDVPSDQVLGEASKEGPRRGIASGRFEIEAGVVSVLAPEALVDAVLAR